VISVQEEERSLISVLCLQRKKAKYNSVGGADSYFFDITKNHCWSQSPPNDKRIIPPARPPAMVFIALLAGQTFLIFTDFSDCHFSDIMVISYH
jgi:hypothetical protein